MFLQIGKLHILEDSARIPLGAFINQYKIIDKLYAFFLEIKYFL